MPKGDNPNSRKNLIIPTTEEARKRGAAGGRKAAENRKQLKSFKELDFEHTTDEQRLKMLEVLMKKAAMGNIKAFEVYRDTVGLKPIEKVQVAEVEQTVIDEVESIFNE